MNTSGGPMNETSDPCYREPNPNLHIQIYFVGVFGTGLAILGFAQNLLLIYIFISKKFYRKSNYFYLTILSALDLIHCCNYLAAMSTAVLSEYFDSLIWLNLIWFHYLIPVVVLDNMVLCASAYLLVAASLERYLAGKLDRNPCNVQRRSFLISGLFTLAISINISTYWEMELRYNPECEGRTLYSLHQGKILNNNAYSLIFAYWCRSIVNMFLPFVLLIVLNFGILTTVTTRWRSKNTLNRRNKGMISFKFRKLLHDTIKDKPDNNNGSEIEEKENASSCQDSTQTHVQGTQLPDANGTQLPKNNSSTSLTAQNQLAVLKTPPCNRLSESGGGNDMSTAWRLSNQSLNGARRRVGQDVRIGNPDVGSGTSKWVKKARTRVKRSTAKSLIAIVAEYVISNGFSVVLAGWERMDYDSLAYFITFYAISSDSVSLLTVVSTVSRLYIYWITDIALRRQIKRILFGTPTRKRDVALPQFKISDATTPPRTFTDVVSLAVVKSRAGSETGINGNCVQEVSTIRTRTPSPSLMENSPDTDSKQIDENEAAKYANLRKFLLKKGML